MAIEFNNKKILLVVAHPDDELLGLGGTMHKLIKENNCKIKVIILGEGITSRSDSRNVKEWSAELKKHRANIAKAAKTIGFNGGITPYSLPDNRFDSIALLDIVKIIEKEKNAFKPEIIFTHHGSDTNIDHRRTFDAVITATRPMAGEPVKTIITFETPSSTEWQAANYPNPFLPNLFVTLSKENITAKINAMECYQYEKRYYPHPRSPKALTILSQQRGITIATEYAEAFMIIRHIN